MRVLNDLQAFGLFALYVAMGLAVLLIFTRAYIWITPYNEVEDIRRGNMAPAVALVGAMLGFTAPLLVASLYGAGWLDYLQWALIACLVQLACFKLLYWLLPKQIEVGNSAAALVYAGAAVCVGLINAFSIIP
jgi:putative membrane protein